MPPRDIFIYIQNPMWMFNGSGWILNVIIIIKRIREFHYFRELHSFVAEAPIRMSVFNGNEMGLPMGRLGSWPMAKRESWPIQGRSCVWEGSRISDWSCLSSILPGRQFGLSPTVIETASHHPQLQFLLFSQESTDIWKYTIF